MVFVCSLEGCGKKGSWITLFKIPFANDTYTEQGHRKTMSMGKLCGFVKEVSGQRAGSPLKAPEFAVNISQSTTLKDATICWAVAPTA